MMGKTFHWGHGIFVFYVVFVLVLATVLIASFGVDHTLVVDDYYAKDLAYQERFDKEARSRSADNFAVLHTAGQDQVTIRFTGQVDPAGTIHWYRPSDSSKDFQMPIQEAEMVIATDDLLPGKWRLKVDWQEAGQQYYREVELYL